MAQHYSRVRKRTKPVQKTALVNFFLIVKMAEYHAKTKEDVRKNMDWFLSRRLGVELK